jgi:hypothetical protein
VFAKGLLEGREPSQWKLPRRTKAKRRNAPRFSALRLLRAEMAQLELCLEARIDRVVLRLASWS